MGPRLAGRRTLLASIAAAMLPRALRAEAPSQGVMRHLGVLLSERADDPALARPAALLQGLAALGWRAGVNLRVDWRFAGGDPVLFERYAAELVVLRPEVIVAGGTPSAVALRRQTTAIPIVFSTVADPVSQGFVESMARPGGTFTGFTDNDPPLTGKRLEMLKEIVPPVQRVAVLYNPATAPVAIPTMRLVEQVAPSLDLAVRDAPVRDDPEIDAAMGAIAREPSSGILVLPDSFTNVHRKTIIGSATRYRLPAAYWNRFFIADGGLMAYGVDYPDLMRRAADYVDRILNGANPGELPVQYPTKFLTLLNLQTAKALGVSFAPSLIAAADEVIE